MLLSTGCICQSHITEGLRLLLCLEQMWCDLGTISNESCSTHSYIQPWELTLMICLLSGQVSNSGVDPTFTSSSVVDFELEMVRHIFVAEKTQLPRKLNQLLA